MDARSKDEPGRGANQAHDPEKEAEKEALEALFEQALWVDMRGAKY